MKISNASLLAVNNALERQKLKHSRETLDLKRRLRESRGGFVPLAQMPNEGLDEDDDDVDDEHEATWDDILSEDPAFAAVATSVETLLRRARDATSASTKEAASFIGARVLHSAEMDTWSDTEADDSRAQIDSSRASDTASSSSNSSSVDPDDSALLPEADSYIDAHVGLGLGIQSAPG